MKQGLIIDTNGTKFWHIDRTGTRKDGLYIDKMGTKWWYKNSRLHNENGPAVIHNWNDPTLFNKEWFIEGKPMEEEEFKQWYRDNRLKQLLG